jgi:glutamate carboxypeptidase
MMPDVETPPLAPIDAQAEERAELLRRWAEINSGTHNLPGLARMEAELVDAFDELGASRTSVPLPLATTIDSAGHVAHAPLGNALLFSTRPHAPLRVLLNIHYDTVYEPDHPFQRVTPAGADELRGPGVVDAKGGIIVMLAALDAFEQSGVAKNIGWTVLLNPDEEIGSPGSANLLAELAKQHHVGLVFEPSFADGMLVDARKGSGTITAVVRGRAAHAGRDFDKGRSAVHGLAHLITRLEHPPAGITINCGKIEGGGAVNIVPDLAIGRFNVRAETLDQQRTVEQLFADAKAQVEQRDGIKVELHGGFNSPPKPLDARSAKLLDHIKSCGRELGMTLTSRPSGGTCDGNKLAAAGLPVIDSLGPVGGELHSDREYVVLSSLAERAKLTALLMIKLASGELTPP